MDIIKVLKRKDASSVVVAVVLALFVSGAVEAWAYRPSAWLSSQSTSGGGWNAGLWRPFITLVIELIILEIVIRIYTWLVSTPGRK
ncbi:MAG TPA: hypothetical protein VF261_01330 [Candidatus Saccharimonadales bacterium]